MSCFLPISELEQRAHGERSVAQPAVTVIPIQVAADAFRQRRCRRGDNGSRDRETQQLQSEGAADNLVVGHHGRVFADGHEISENGLSRGCAEAGLQDVRVGNVLARYGVRGGGRNSPKTSSLAIKYCGENGGRVKSWPAESFHGA